MPNSSDVIVCPPDRQVLVEYLHLRNVLAAEVANAVPACQQQLPQLLQLLQLLELICHMEYLQESRLIKSAMTHTKPMISNDEQHSMAASCGAAASEQGMLLLEHMISLLLEARYFPLSAQEWAVAQKHQFTFDIPVQIDWSVLDDQLLTAFWNRQADATAVASATSNGSSSSSSSGSDSDSDSGRRSGKSTEESTPDNRWDTHWQSASSSSSSSSSPLLDRSQLPAFFDRMLVFHRSVGVATAEGLYLDKKLDLLLGYLLVNPVTEWLDKFMRSLGLSPQSDADAAAAALTARDVQHRAAATAAAGSSVSLAGWGASSPEALSHQNDDEELRPFASADLSHQYARLVVRSSLRSLMPGPKQVLQKLLQRLVLLEPTFRDVVVVYRATSPAATGEAEASAAQAADSAMTAAVYAASGTPTLAIDAIVEAAKAAAEAKSVDSDDQQQKPSQPQVQTIDTSRRVKLNPSNIIVKSFSEVALADLELVFPSKKAEVRPTTLVRSAVIAMGAVGAVAAFIQQMSSMHWSLPVVMSAAAVVAGRAIKVLSTIRNQQASLNNIMMTMQYDAARDSQEGVVIKLIDDLREQHLKEAALAYTLMLTQAAAIAQWQQTQQKRSSSKGTIEADTSSNSSSTSDSGADLTAVVFGSRQIDAACEDFLLQRFGLKTDFMIDETLPRMVAWGLLQQRAPDQYSLVPISQALDNLQTHWQAMQQAGGAAGGTTSTAAAYSWFNGDRSSNRSGSNFHAADEFASAAAVASAAQHSTAVQAIPIQHYKQASAAGLRRRQLPMRQLGRRCAAPAVVRGASLGAATRLCV